MRFLHALRVAFGFLTIIPVGRPDISETDLGRAVAWFPVVGLVLGAVIAGLAWLLDASLGPALIGLIVVAVSAWLTGGLHLDGVADVFDGLGGGRGDRERTLEIMRDSHIGSHGTAALVLLLAAKIIASGEVVAQQQILYLGLAPLLARALVVPLIALLPYARPEGLGSTFHRRTGALHIACAVAASAAAIGYVGASALVPLAVAAAAVLILSALICRRVGGLTGDAYGTAIELGEVMFLMAATAL